MDSERTCCNTIILRTRLGRNAVAIGDVAGFLDRNRQQRSGRIVRLNDKTVTLHCGHQQWRVSYGLLHRVVDSSVFNGDTLELEILDSRCEPDATERNDHDSSVDSNPLSTTSYA